jgi:hypothetical protein
MDSCQDVPQYKVMKYLVLGIILSSLLSELQVMIPKVDHHDHNDGVCTVSVLYISGLIAQASEVSLN